MSDTTPLHYLARLDRLELLRSLYHRVWVPAAVWRECLAAEPRWPESVQRLRAAMVAGWLEEKGIDTDHLTRLPATPRLDEGEREAITLALDTPGTLLLIDEIKGRAVATRLGVAVTGTIGVLLKAKQRKLIPAVRPLLDELRSQTNYHLSPALVAAALKAADEL